VPTFATVFPSLIENHDLIRSIGDDPQAVFLVEKHSIGTTDAGDPYLGLTRFAVHHRHANNRVVTRVPHEHGSLGMVER
jgi:hypothetical protein